MVLVSLKLVCSSTVQHPRPRAQVTADLATLRWLAWAVAVAFPGQDLSIASDASAFKEVKAWSFSTKCAASLVEFEGKRSIAL